MASTFLAFDLGATSGRAILGRLRGGLLSIEEIHRFPNDPVVCNGHLHWDLPRLWSEMQTALARGAGIDSVGVDAWGVDYALVGEKGALLANPFHYRDSSAEVMEKAIGVLGRERIYDATGIQFMQINTLYQLYRASLETPKLLAAAERLLTIPDLMNFWLSGVMGCEYTNATTTQFLDRKTRSWSHGLLKDLGIPTHLLGPVIEPGTVLGKVGQSAALLVAPACHDTGSAVAAVRAGGDTAFLSSGTWSLLGTEVAAPIVNPQALRLNFTNEGGVCGTVRLLKNITGMWLLEGCRKSWSPEVNHELPELMAMASAAEPFQHLVDPDHASFVRPEKMTTAVDVYCRDTGQPAPSAPGAYVRAVLESLALKYRYVLDQLESLTGRRCDTIRVIGGGSQNDLLNQFTADATGRKVLAGPAEATALGNLAMQMVGTNAVPSLDAARDLVERSFPARIFESRHSGKWEEAYCRLKTAIPQ